MARQKLPRMLERIRRCHRCGIEVERPPLEYEETPYCANCLSEALREREIAGLSLQRVGHYVEITRVEQRPR
jgi:uncharacterized paraquat-inducible protein A